MTTYDVTIYTAATPDGRRIDLPDGAFSSAEEAAEWVRELLKVVPAITTADVGVRCGSRSGVDWIVETRDGVLGVFDAHERCADLDEHCGVCAERFAFAAMESV